MASLALNDSSLVEGDSEDEFDWEEVQVPEQRHLEITLQTRPKSDAVTKKKGISYAERLTRINCHKIHTVCLLANARSRNQWINDPLLHARLLSLAPLPLQNAFAMIHKSRVPDQNQRGRLFESTISRLAEWWSNTFFEVSFEGHIRNRTFDDVQKGLTARGLSSQSPSDSALELETIEDVLDDEGELIRSSKSLMKHALMRTGSRDTSAQLFTALCRGLGIPARLVVSLQSMPWQAGVGKPKPRYQKKSKGQGKTKDNENNVEGEEGENDLEEVEIPGPAFASVSGADVKGKGKAKAFMGEGQRLDGAPVTAKSDKGKGKAKPVIKLRKTKDKGNVLGSGSPSGSVERSGSSSRQPEPPDPVTTPPVFWTEVFSRADARWLPVDPIRCIINKRKVFDPSPTSSTLTSSTHPSSTIYPHPYAPGTPVKKVARSMNQENRMVYVLAFEEDGYARDVTRRYAREFGAKVAKVQGGSSNVGVGGSGGKGRQEWWERVVGIVRRPYRLHRDDVEDEELEAHQMTEGMPTTIAGFKDHPLYVLPRHVKRTQTIHPPPPATPELGKFRGEPVYPRSSVVSLKTAENWMRNEGRVVKEGCQAMKSVKMRAGTVGRMRELEVLREGLMGAGGSGEGDEREMMQGLYARNQTEPYIPEPVIDGKIPKNNFGNIDLYVPSMLPDGAVHIPFKGTVKIARKLGFDHAEAVTGFEFKKRKAYPVVEGIVIAAENEAVLLEAYWEAEQDAEEKARIKREERVIKQWTRLVQGLRIRQRLQQQYAGKPEQEHGYQGAQSGDSGGGDAKILDAAPQTGGGFLVDADDVVQAFHLPRYQYQQDSLPPSPQLVGSIVNGDDGQDTNGDVPDVMSYDVELMDVDSDIDEVIPMLPASGNGAGAPKTMRELAEDAARKEKNANLSGRDDESTDGEEYDPSLSVSTLVDKSKRSTRSSEATYTTSTPTGGRNTPATKRKAPAQSKRRGSAKKRAINDEVESDTEAQHQSSTAKRGRIRDTVVPAPTTAPTRVLRPRSSKSHAQIQEEKEREEAFKQAVEE